MLSNLCCPTCRKHFTKSEEQILVDDCMGAVQCGCGNTVDIFSVQVKVDPDCTYYLLQPDAIYQTQWFHLTTQDDWLETVQGADIMVHVGTWNTVMEYGKMRGRSGMNTSRLYVHTLNLRRSARIEPTLVNDDNYWFPFEEGRRNIRYLNRWEGPGQISLLVEAKHLDLVETVRYAEVTN